MTYIMSCVWLDYMVKYFQCKNCVGSSPKTKKCVASFLVPGDINAASVFTMLAAFYFFATCRRVYRKKRTVTEPIGGRLCEQAV